MSAPTRLQVRYANRRALLSSARNEGAVMSLFVPGSERVQAGTEVSLEISVAGTELHFYLDGRVRIQITGPREDPGLGVIFTGERKRLAAQMLSRCAESGATLQVRHEVDVRCLIDLHGVKMKGALKDISATGAFIGAPKKLASLRGHSELTIRLEPILGVFGGRVLKARVVWIGQKKGVPGFGVCFLDASAHVKRSLKKHLPLTES